MSAPSQGRARFWQSYARILEASPVVVKLCQAAVLSSIGNITGQLASGASVDVHSTMCYVLATAPPYSHFWYMFLDKLKLPVLVKILLDQFCWRSLMILVDFVSYGCWAGHPWSRISHTTQTTFVKTWKKGIVLWSGVSYVNQSFVPALYQTVLNDAVAFFWTMYMAVQIKGKGPGSGGASSSTPALEKQRAEDNHKDQAEPERPLFSGNIQYDPEKPGPMDRFLTHKGKKVVKVEKRPDENGS